MKTLAQLEAARKRLRERVVEPGLSDVQTALIMGMLNAVLWTIEAQHSDTMERMLSNEPMDVGKNHSAAFDRLRRFRK